MKTVCAVVVTYNRKDYLLELLTNGLLKQSYPIDKILIYDNHSSDGTAELLKSKDVIGEYTPGVLGRYRFEGMEILYFHNVSNDGGSGGFHGGMKLAMEEDCDYIWTMDDDVCPDENCLKELVKNLDQEHRVCLPSRTDERNEDKAIVELNMTNPFLYSTGLRKKSVKSSKISTDTVVIKDMVFEGPIFDRTIIEEIGLPKKDLFIIFDDTEYAYRVSRVTDILYVKGAVLHRQIIPIKVPGQLMGWKQYYGFRNQYWFDRTYGKNNFVKTIRPLLSYLDMSLRAVYRRKWSNLRVMKRAYHDGTHGLLGKTVEPGEKI